MVDGILQTQPSGRWAVVPMDGDPVEISSGDQFYIEVPGGGAMALTRMEYGYLAGRGQYYAVDGHQLRAGLRASFVGRGYP